VQRARGVPGNDIQEARVRRGVGVCGEGESGRRKGRRERMSDEWGGEVDPGDRRALKVAALIAPAKMGIPGRFT
jgi:hypothetical protein